MKTARKEIRRLGPTISSALLFEAAQKGPQWGYNRQLCDKKIGKLPAFGRYKIDMVLPHFHAFGVRVPEHRRIVVVIGDSLAFVDVPLEFAQRIHDEAKAAERRFQKHLKKKGRR